MDRGEATFWFLTFAMFTILLLLGMFGYASRMVSVLGGSFVRITAMIVVGRVIGGAISSREMMKYRVQAEIFQTVMNILVLVVIASAIYEASYALSALGISVPSALISIGRYAAAMRFPVIVWAFLMYYQTGKMWYAWVGTTATILVAANQLIVQRTYLMLLGLAVFSFAVALLYKGLRVDLTVIGTFLTWASAAVGIEWAITKIPQLFPGIPLSGVFEALERTLPFLGALPLVSGIYHLWLAIAFGRRGVEGNALLSMAIYALITYGMYGFTLLWEIVIASIALWILFQMGGFI